MEIKKSEYIKSLPDFRDFDLEKRTQIAFIGRSNVGKSSLINYLCNNQNLAKTSKNPGKTRYFNYFNILLSNLKKQIKKLYFVDLPGYGYAKHSKSTRDTWSQKMMNYFIQDEDLKLVCLLVDDSIKVQQLDLEMALFLNKIQRNFCLILTKSDKKKEVKKTAKESFLEAFEGFEVEPKIFQVSSLKKTGRESLLEYFYQILSY